MKKGLKIISCCNENFWYNDKIGEQFEVKWIDTDTNYYVVEVKGIDYDYGSVNPLDCEVFEVEDNVVVREIINEPSEVDYLLDLDYRISKIELGL